MTTAIHPSEDPMNTAQTVLPDVPRTEKESTLPPSSEHAMGYRVFALVYQGGIANVFEIRTANLGTWGREAKRILQADFRTCEIFLRGILAGSDKNLAITGQCNMAGDIVNQNWSGDLDAAPFSDKFRPIFKGYKPVK